MENCEIRFPVQIIWEMPNSSTNYSYNFKELPIDYYSYQTFCTKPCPQNSGLTFFLVKQLSTQKINAYASLKEFDTYRLVKYYQPLGYVAAKFIFPEFNLEESKYGFKYVQIDPRDFKDK